jgi:hypothetical protein
MSLIKALSLSITTPIETANIRPHKKNGPRESVLENIFISEIAYISNNLNEALDDLMENIIDVEVQTEHNINEVLIEVNTLIGHNENIW